MPSGTKERQSDRRSALDLVADPVVKDRPVGYIREIPVEKIVSNRHQPRTIFSDEGLKDLAKSIQAEGLIQPITVRPLPAPTGDGKDAAAEPEFELVAGERRLRAHKLLKTPTIKAIIENISEDKLRLLAMIENLQREDLPVMDKALGIAALKEELGTVGAVAKAVGVSDRFVQYNTKIAKMPEPFRNVVRAKGLDYRTSIRLASFAIKLGEIAPEKQEKKIEKVLEKMSVADIDVTEDLIEGLEQRFVTAKSTPPAKKGGGETVSPPPPKGGFQEADGKCVLRLEAVKEKIGAQERNFFIKQSKQFFKALGAKKVEIKF